MITYNDIKFNKFIFYPDYANKFVLKAKVNIPSSKELMIYFLYSISQKRVYNLLAIKALLMISSIYSRKALTKSRLIVLKYTKTRYNSFIFLKINLEEFIGFMKYFPKKPVDINKALKSFIPSGKYFTFPGFIRLLQLPSWERPVMLCYYNFDKKAMYTLFFYRLAYID